jgi:hypothetical protein
MKDTFVCNICELEYPNIEKEKNRRRCKQCHKEKEKERRIIEWKQIKKRRENYKERAKLVQKEYIIKNKDIINEKRKIYKEKKILEELTEPGVKEIMDKWILFTLKHSESPYSEKLSIKQKAYIMSCYEHPI